MKGDVVAFIPSWTIILKWIIGILVIFQLGITFPEANSTPEVFTNSFLVKIKGDTSLDKVHQIAKRNGFTNLGKVVGADDEFHFKHDALPHARTKRSVQHIRKLKSDPHIKHAVQQSGFKRVKRGFRPLRVENLIDIPLDSEDPTDPYFQFQW